MSPRQRVDPFIPVRPAQKHKPLAGQYGTQWLSKPDPTTTPGHAAAAFRPARPAMVQNTEGIIHAPVRPAHPTPQQPTPQSHPAHSPRPGMVSDIHPARPTVRRNEHVAPPTLRPTQPTSQPTHAVVETEPQKIRPHVLVRLLQKTQLLGFMLVAIMVGLLAQSLVFGELAIGVYAIFALTRRVTSQATFLLALIALLGIVLLVSINANSVMANNFAVYAFLLLTVGTISLGLEIRRRA